MNMRNLTKADLMRESIINAARMDPTFCMCLHLHQRGVLTWEECLGMAVLYLIEQNRMIHEELVKQSIRMGPEAMIVEKPSAETASDPLVALSEKYEYAARYGVSVFSAQIPKIRDHMGTVIPQVASNPRIENGELLCDLATVPMGESAATKTATPAPNEPETVKGFTSHQIGGPDAMFFDCLFHKIERDHLREHGRSVLWAGEEGSRTRFAFDAWRYAQDNDKNTLCVVREALERYDGDGQRSGQTGEAIADKAEWRYVK